MPEQHPRLRARWIAMKLLVVAIVACSSPAAPPAPPPPVDAKPAPASIPSGRVLAAGDTYVCARTADAGVTCWGGDDGYEMPKPTPIANVAKVAGVTVGQYDGCAWHEDGTVSCWSWLGDDHGASKVPGLTDVVELVGGSGAVCARTKTRAVSCWARERDPQTKGTPVFKTVEITDALELAIASSVLCARQGNGVVNCLDVTSPAPFASAVQLARGATSIAGSGHKTTKQFYVPPGRFLAILPDGRVVGWQVGDAEWKLPPLPDGARAVAVGIHQACVTGDVVTCWKDDELPATLPGSAKATGVALGLGVGCITRGHEVACWGVLDRLGTGTKTGVSKPTDVLTDATAIASVAGEVCAKTTAGKVRCLGLEGAVDKAITLPAAGRGPWTGGMFRQSYSCKRVGSAIKCRSIYHGRNAPPEDTPMTELDRELAALGPTVDLVFHAHTIYVLSASGEVHGANLQFSEPLTRRATDATAIALGGVDRVIEEDCALRKTGQVVCWQTFAPSKQRILVEDATQLISGPCALRKTGAVTCWEREVDRELGKASAAPVITPGLVL